MKEIAMILKKGELHLTKFVSNGREILKSFPHDDLSASHQSVNLDLDKITLERVLGILWNPDNGTIKIKAVIKSFSSSKEVYLVLYPLFLIRWDF